MKKLLVPLVLALPSAPALTAAPTAVDRVVACSAIGNSGERLRCFDREVATLAGAGTSPPTNSQAPSAPAPVARAPAPAAPAPAAPASTSTALASSAATFGQEQLAPEKRPAPATEELVLHAHLTSQRSAGGGMFNLFLDNGQVWRHEDQVQGPYLKPGDAITIAKGALGSYRLTRDAGASKNWIRVTRVR